MMKLVSIVAAVICLFAKPGNSSGFMLKAASNNFYCMNIVKHETVAPGFHGVDLFRCIDDEEKQIWYMDTSGRSDTNIYAYVGREKWCLHAGRYGIYGVVVSQDCRDEWFLKQQANGNERRNEIRLAQGRDEQCAGIGNNAWNYEPLNFSQCNGSIFQGWEMKNLDEIVAENTMEGLNIDFTDKK
eukprot:CAMPEP_0172489898 /NCGR_PEP_ID=MMETSP1066-20121228/20171_1 /TAXON_ID=671091 /ORGANISM="Coscinodiscus wailesii, Strain CCMP2513" /LENGTH=184 /DNA_ID=CAMNT_0013258093 /DNA_START=77 /DNA_END=631 /DNA_ORIENTATION=+